MKTKRQIKINTIKEWEVVKETHARLHSFCNYMTRFNSRYQIYQEMKEYFVPTLDQRNSAYLSHNSIRPCPLFILEDNIRIIIRNKFPEFRIFSGDFPVWETASGQRSFGKIWFMLFINKRKDFPWSSASYWTSPWSTGGHEAKIQGEGYIMEKLHNWRQHGG